MLRSQRRVDRAPPDARARRARFVDARVVWARPLQPAALLALPPADAPARARAGDAPGGLPPVSLALTVSISIPLTDPLALLTLALLLLLFVLFVVVQRDGHRAERALRDGHGPHGDGNGGVEARHRTLPLADVLADADLDALIRERARERRRFCSRPQIAQHLGDGNIGGERAIVPSIPGNFFAV